MTGVAHDSGERGDGHDPAGGTAAGIGATRRRVARAERELWAVALLALLGDLVLTVYGLEQGLTEANPVARAAVERYGYVALAGLKAVALLVGVLGWVVLPRRYRAVIPLALAVPWTFAVVVNVMMLALVP